MTGLRSVEEARYIEERTSPASSGNVEVVADRRQKQQRFEHDADEGHDVEICKCVGVALVSLTRRRHRVAQAKDRSTTQRLGSRTKPFSASGV